MHLFFSFLKIDCNISTCEDQRSCWLLTDNQQLKNKMCKKSYLIKLQNIRELATKEVLFLFFSFFFFNLKLSQLKNEKVFGIKIDKVISNFLYFLLLKTIVYRKCYKKKTKTTWKSSSWSFQRDFNFCCLQQNKKCRHYYVSKFFFFVFIFVHWNS